MFKDGVGYDSAKLLQSGEGALRTILILFEFRVDQFRNLVDLAKAGDFNSDCNLL